MSGQASLPNRTTPSVRRAACWLAGLGLTTVLAVVALRGHVPARIGGDFICFWTAAKIVSAGESPYDPGLQTRIQRDLGWDKATDGLGVYEYMPYFYPPWFAFLVVPLLPLGYVTAKTAWLVLDAEALVLTGYLLRNAVKGVPRSVAIVLIPLFACSLIAVLYAQVAPLVLLACAVGWRLLQASRPGLAGAALCWLTIKPQLTGIALAGLLFWSIRNRRWTLAASLVAGVLALCAVSTALIPRWPIQMLQAMHETALPTDLSPWYGTTWLAVLRTAGIGGPLLWLLYGSAVVLSLGLVSRAILDRRGDWREVLAAGLLAAFFVTPYARVYDFPLLLVPALLLLGDRLPQVGRSLLLLLLLVVPYAHILRFPTSATQRNYTFFWIPALLAIAWCFSLRVVKEMPGTSESPLAKREERPVSHGSIH